MFDISLVGTGGMMPLPGRHLSALLMRFEGRMLLIDCGEGTQVSVRQVGWGFKNIDCICLTHYHADHVSGLPGLLLAIGNAGRTDALTMVGPPGLAHVVRSLCVITGEIPFAFNFIELPQSGRSNIQIPLTNFFLSAKAVEHNCVCMAYRLDIRRKGRFDPAAAQSLGLPVKTWSILQRGENVEFDNKIFTPDMVMGAARKGLRVAYCTDTRPPRGLPAFINGADVFVCEGHYGGSDMLDKAKSHRHMIFAEAARLALEGNVKQLWLTHFSPAMLNPAEFAPIAKQIFPNTLIGYDRMTQVLNFED